MNNKSIGLKAIAYELNISINTVSRALRDCDDISDATKEKVRKKAYELHYLPNNVSQFVKRDGKQLVTIVVHNLKNIYFSIICDKLVGNLNERDYDFNVVCSLKGRLDIDIVKQCISQRTYGIITLLEPDDDAIEIAKLNGIPLVMVGRRINKDYVDEIYTDDEMGGTLAANYLVNYHKLDKLVYFNLSDIECALRRKKSFINTVKKIAPNAEVKIIDYGESETEYLQLINQGFLGFFCYSDEIAYKVLDELNKHVPNIRQVYPRLHIVGYDCLSARIPGLRDITTIDFDYDGICKEALNCVMKNANGENLEKRTVVFPVKLHQRKYF